MASKGVEDTYDTLQEIEGYVDIGYVQPIRTSVKTFEKEPEIVKDMRFQFKSVLIGVKSCLVAIRTIDGGARPTSHVSFGIESVILSRVFLHGLDCFEYLFLDSEKDKPPAAVKEDKDIVEAFSSIFTVIDPAMFQEVCAEHIPYLFEKALLNAFIIAIPQYFLASTAVSANFSSPLLTFLIARFDDVGLADSPKATVMLRLFKLLFLALSMFPEPNERVFQPHLAGIIMASLKVSAKAQEPMNYFLLLRGLFRSIGGGKFEILYQEVIPLLQVLLETMNSLLVAALKPQMRELFVELCLTVPVRLSVLLPHLSYLMRPLVIALHAGPELVNQSLKTLELCIDNLNHEFLEPIFAPVKEELMAALWKHLRPIPYNPIHSHTTMRILGKFGGRNRRILRDQSILEFDPLNEEALQLSFYMHGSNGIQNLPITQALLCANQILQSSENSVLQHEQAFIFTKSCAPLFFDLECDPDLLEGTIACMIEKYKAKNAEEGPPVQDHPFIDFPAFTKERREVIDKSLTKMIMNLLIAATMPNLAAEAWILLENLTRHFALLDLNETANASLVETKPQYLVFEVLTNNATSSLNGFLRAMVEGTSSEKRELREMTEKVLVFFKGCYLELLGSDADVDKVVSFQILALWYGSECYQQDWFKRSGGCFGLNVLTAKLSFGTQWMLKHEIEFVKALLYILKDVSAGASQVTVPNANDTLMHILRVCNENQTLDDEFYVSKLNNLILVLISELSNSNKAVRTTVQGCLQLLAELSKRTVTDILLPVRDRLLYPIFAKPLRALPFALQIGYIDAVTYGLNLRPPLVIFTDELGRLLHEALALADAEDHALSNKDNLYKNASTMNNLRVECIKLLSAIMESPDISTPKLVNIRTRIITLFFKCLYSKSSDVILVAHTSLADIIRSHGQQLPKHLLQAGLKPILLNLSDWKKLTVAGLEGLGRLLQLLTNYFKVEIVRKLLDHLRLWAEPMKMEECSSRALAGIDDINIIASILSIFCRLPAAAVVFIDEIVVTVIELEAMIHRSCYSPFRKPLALYLSRYSAEAFDYFAERLTSPLHTDILVALLRSGHAGALVEKIKLNPTKIFQKIFPEVPREDTGAVAILQSGINLLLCLAELSPEWLNEHREFLDAALTVWKSHKEGAFVDMFARKKQTAAILKIAMIICSQNLEDVELLFEIIEGFLDPDLTDFNFLKQFVYQESRDSSLSRRHLIFKTFFNFYARADVSYVRKTNLIRYLIIPMLSMNKSDYSTVINDECIQLCLKHIWTPVLPRQTSVDNLVIELLQLTAIILYQVPELVKEQKLIMFGWYHAKSDDMTIKQSSYVIVTKFIKEHVCPAKIVIQTYITQLRSHQIEIRPMVKQALDNLIPILPERLGKLESIPAWVQWIRKIAIEDGHSVSQLVAIYQLLIRNSCYFYESREHFMVQIVNSLARLGLSGNCTAETKSLSIDLTILICKWENQYRDSCASRDLAIASNIESAGGFRLY